MKGAVAVYHCVTRTVNGEIWWDDVAKKVLRKQLWQVAEFCGVQVLTYCIMSNHFHVLVSVPEKEGADAAVTDSELLRRYQVMYPNPRPHKQSRVEVLEQILRDGGEDAEALRSSLLSRMHDLGAFMHALKQRFSIWYNKRHGRFGTLWAERYKSVLVQGEGSPLLTMALYIDLNPVRAGIVEDPKDYRFSGYAEAVAGKKPAKAGIGVIISSFMGQAKVQAMSVYRKRLFGRGSTSGGGSDGARISRKKALKVLQQQDGDLALHEVLRCKCSYFTDGAVIGLRDFVQAHMPSKKRQPKPAKHLGDLHVQKGINKPVFA